MAKVIPFKALRYNTDKINDLSKVTTPPYDIISPAEQEAFYELSENNIIRLEYGKEYDTDNEHDNRYTRAGETLKKWIDEGILVFEDKPALYLYEEIFEAPNGELKAFKGFMGLTELCEFDKKVVLPHEETLSKAKADRFNLMTTTHSNFSQIYCLYMDSERVITNEINKIAKAEPTVSFVDSFGITQNLWVVTDEAVIKTVTDAFSDKQLFIADGHHRYETALNFRNKMREENPNYTQDDLFNYVMMVLVDMDDPGLLVLPTHRMVKNLESFDEAKIIDAVSEMFEVSEKKAKDDVGAAIEADLALLTDEKAFGFYTGGKKYYILTLKDTGAMKKALPGKSDAYLDLDVSVLHTLILDKVFGIDMQNMAAQKNLFYTKFAKEAVESVDSGEYQCSFFLNATKVRQIKDVSLANEKMPQKSTYFYPKIITGLVMNKF